MPLRLLSPDTIGKIAAGEVVERPASIVKELVENALDAGASRILVTLRGGGSELIEVADNGHGMVASDLAIAVQRHATSKLSSFDDLDRLQTLGFRGEALPSIGAVSDLTLRSRPAGGSHGAELRLEFGRQVPARDVGAPPGTVVTVRDLFANVPARRKFLRQAATEAGYAVRAVSAYACAYPDIAIELTVDQRRVFATSGSGDLAAAAVSVIGPDVGAAVVPLAELEPAAAIPGVAVSGWVGAPAVHRSQRHGMVFFVNGRWIQSRSLSFALEDAYHSLLMVGRHPLCVVRITVDPAAVDVNVHPTKAEVKFVDERAVARAVQRAAHAALARAPRDDLPPVRLSPWTAGHDREQQTLPNGGPGRFLPFARRSLGDDEEPAASVAAHPSGIPVMRVLGQVGASFIIAEGPDGMYLIDQHAAHERVMYEKILFQMQQRAIDRQGLLDPIVVELSPEEQAIFERSREELAEIGFEIEPFGDGAVAIRAIPAIVRGVDVAERLHLILGELVEGGAGDSWLDAVAISTACHTSIRAGQLLSLPEMRELVADLERSSQPRACGHGRPTMLHVSQADLERQFGRR
ncbi:MAG: DNA mismatch repair endonuclease MutL [Chloroflexota bacterium]|nr:DNA mismatch repair endonuclease MutL [Chloroflexota bacterium]